MKVLSFVIPAYNEEKTLETLVHKVMEVKLPARLGKEIVIVDDRSKDNTLMIARRLAKKFHEIRVLSNERNQGKSQSVRKGILKTTGRYVIIQDADLEYEPAEIAQLVDLFLNNNLHVVYGNRFGVKNKIIYLHYYFGNKLISFVSNLFTYPRIRVWIPDVEVCYKLIDGKIARAVAKKLISTSTFGLEPEITARLSTFKKNGRHLKFGIVPISYKARKISEGKKIRAVHDGVKALGEIIYFNIVVK